MDPDTIESPATTFTLKVTGGASVTGIVAYDVPTQIATFTPDDDLAVGTAYISVVHGR
jgi:hypothetical protein